MADKTLEQQIEQLRLQMYQAYNQGKSGNKVLRISEELDALLNQLSEMNNEN
ncbi:MAG TPA: aspartyl-phosphate phosphatase Spo0E family protein [Virgibacillus sp.]|nr:aspartyl-phosphate phosphatase Spo0E family protein [Virgibacillus sp.]